MKPALTEKQWAEISADPRHFAVFVSDASDRLASSFDQWPEQQMRHAVSALALQGQPFGFTREQADAIRAIVVDARLMYARASGLLARKGPAACDKAEEAAACIEALLPPETAR